MSQPSNLSENTEQLLENHALCIDLDGTLINSDILYESLLCLLAKNPLFVFLVPFWLLKGRAFLKHQLALRVSLPAETLPYNPKVLDLLNNTKYRPRVLCSASDILLVEPIAKHLGVFERVIASDGETNLSGKKKAAALSQAFGEKKFYYAGNGKVDLHVWEKSAGAWVVNNTTSLSKAAEKLTRIYAHWPAPSRLSAWIKALRLHQWLKNLLVLVPLLTAHRFLEISAVTQSIIALIAFGLCASGVYILNDLLDLTPDRMHPRKKLRPFAAGRIPLLHGLCAAPILTLAGLLLSTACNLKLTLILAAYYIMTLAYSLKLKRIVMVDVVLLASLYTVRIIGGAMAISGHMSFWLLAFSMFIFLSLALLKRYTELHAMLITGKKSAIGRGYTVEDLQLLQSLGASAGYIAVMVMALYINSPESMMLYRHPQVLWLICPVLLYWMSRVWIIAHRGLMHDDPIVFAATDRTSQLVILLCGLFALGAI